MSLSHSRHHFSGPVIHEAHPSSGPKRHKDPCSDPGSDTTGCVISPTPSTFPTQVSVSPIQDSHSHCTHPSFTEKCKQPLWSRLTFTVSFHLPTTRPGRCCYYSLFTNKAKAQRFSLSDLPQVTQQEEQPAFVSDPDPLTLAPRPTRKGAGHCDDPVLRRSTPCGDADPASVKSSSPWAEEGRG